MTDNRRQGRLTIPTDMDVVAETIEIVERLGADALRDCDGTEMPDELKELPVKIYSTYYTTRKDNAWAMRNPEEIQQVYLMTDYQTAMESDGLRIKIMKQFYEDQLKPDTLHDIRRWWEVIDRTTGRALAPEEWGYEADERIIVIPDAEQYHEYSVSFLAYIIWDPVHMYNYLTNDWSGAEHQMTYDVRLPKTKAYALAKFRKWLEEHPDTDVVRFTTFFHQFTLVFDELAREKFVDWFGYSASVSTYILEQFEQEAGYRFRPEYIIDQGYHNNTNRVPSRQFLDFMEFQQREVAALIREFTAICHEYGKEAMMFLGDHWIGTEPYGKYFRDTGVDAVVGSVGNGTTLRLIADIPGVKYTEGRLLPYFFPNVFRAGGDPVREAAENWITARRAMLRKLVDRIGYGGYLKLALQFPEFIDYIEQVCQQFRELYDAVRGQAPYEFFTVGIINSWGEIRSWGTHMVAHAIDYKQTYSYAGVMEALSGMPFEVKFISFDEIKERPQRLQECQVIINMGDAFTAPCGGEKWADPALQQAVKAYVAGGGGFIGIGEPTACTCEGHYFALASVLGVDKEIGFSLSADKYNWEERPHFITQEHEAEYDFGEGMKNIYAFRETQVLRADGWQGQDVQMAVHSYGKGRSVYLSGLPYSVSNSRLLYRALFWAAGQEEQIRRWYSENSNVEVNYYPASGRYCVVNNDYGEQHTVVYDGTGTAREVRLGPGEIKWYEFCFNI